MYVTSRYSATQALLKRLNQVPDVRVDTEEDVEHLQAECDALKQRIIDLHLRDSCPDDVWNYLSDVDLRFKNTEHAIRQLPLYLQSLSNWSTIARDSDASQIKWKDSKKLIFTSLLIFFGIFLISNVVVKYRENSCAQQCLKSGKRYRYQDFTGTVRSSLKADRCTCIN